MSDAVGFKPETAGRIMAVVNAAEGTGPNLAPTPTSAPRSAVPGFWAEITGIFSSATGYPWKRLKPKADGTGLEDCSPAITGTRLFDAKDAQDVTAGTRTWIVPNGVNSTGNAFFVFAKSGGGIQYGTVKTTVYYGNRVVLVLPGGREVVCYSRMARQNASWILPLSVPFNLIAGTDNVPFIEMASKSSGWTQYLASPSYGMLQWPVSDFEWGTIRTTWTGGLYVTVTPRTNIGGDPTGEPDVNVCISSTPGRGGSLATGLGAQLVAGTSVYFTRQPSVGSSFSMLLGTVL